MYKDLLKNKNYCLLQMANLVNRLGDSIDAIALSWLVYEISKNPAISAINFAINYLPTVFLQPIMGAYIAKYDKKKIILLSDIIRSIIIGFLALSLYLNKATTFHILFSTFLMSCVETFRQPAHSSLIPLIIDKENYANATSFSTSLARICEIIGSGLAAFIISILGVNFAVLLDAISFILSSFFISLIKIHENIDKTIQSSSFFINLKEGFNYALNHKILLLLSIFAALANLVLIPINALQAAFISEFYNNDATYLSIMSVAISLGSLLGGLIYPKISSLFKTKEIILSIFTISGIYYLLLVLGSTFIKPYTYIAIALSSLMSGIIVGFASCHLSVLTMLKTNQNYLSRISALNNSISLAFIPPFSFIIGILSQYIKIDTLFIIIGIIILVISTLAYFDKRLEILNE